MKVTRTASKQIKKLDQSTQERIIKFLRTTVENSNNPRQVGKALTGKLGNLWRYRVGDYRIICRIKDNLLVVLVLEVGHRKDVYD